MIKSRLFLLSSLLFSAAYSYSAADTKENQLHMQLINAVIEGNEDRVQAFIEARADINKKGKCGQTPLFIAAKKNHREIAELLIIAQADVNKSINNNCFPLYIAASRGHRDIVELLIGTSANVNQVWAEEITCLDSAICAAIRNNNQEVFQLIVDAQADVNLFVLKKTIDMELIQNQYLPTKQIQKERFQRCAQIIQLLINAYYRQFPILPIEGTGNLSILSSEIIDFNIISRLAPQDFASFKLVNRCCYLLTHNEWIKRVLTDFQDSWLKGFNAHLQKKHYTKKAVSRSIGKCNIS